jgi:hypothetical protein
MKTLSRWLIALAITFPSGAFAQGIGGGGQGGNTVTQGTPASSANAWPTVPTIGGEVNSSGNPIFVQLTAGAATLGNVGLIAGSAIVGKFGIDQTTQGTTNAVTHLPLTGAQGGGLTAQVTAALQASSTAITGNRNLYAAYAVSVAGAAGYFVCVNATSISAGAITPVDVVPIGAGPAFAVISYGSSPPGSYGTGITWAVTTAATPFTYTSGGSQFFYHISSN